jgi:hypothetical protein
VAPQSVAQRKAQERERMRALGLVLIQAWVHPKDLVKVRAYLHRLLKRHIS